MGFSTIIMVLLLGIIVLLIGFVTKKRWLKLLSIIPLVISAWHLSILFLMGFH
ncbi:MAG: hypothetical protein K0S51_1222 [Bacillales bacterium]|jgi:sulfite exporter TauE/SafE|nr:hypothetical protein [Bacillales bacterium]